MPAGAARPPAASDHGKPIILLDALSLLWEATCGYLQRTRRSIATSSGQGMRYSGYLRLSDSSRYQNELLFVSAGAARPPMALDRGKPVIVLDALRTCLQIGPLSLWGEGEGE
jgi:hypothetical protein